MSTAEVALLLHIFGAVTFLAGAADAAVAQAAAARLTRPREIALLLRIGRVGVALVGTGLLVLVPFGLWLVELTARRYGETWLVATFALLGSSLVTGTVGGRRARHARELAERLAEERASESRDLIALVRDPLAWALNLSAGAAGLAVLVLMVWRPGG